MKDIDRRCRRLLVRAALERISTLAGHEFASRADLFHPNFRMEDAKDYDVDILSMQRQMAKTAWMKPVINRLIEYKLLKARKDPTDKATVYSWDRLDRVKFVLDDDDKGGIRLSWFIFTAEVPGGEPKFDDEIAEVNLDKIVEIVDSGSEEKTAQDDSLVVTIRLMLESHREVLKQIDKLVKYSAGLGETIRDGMGAIEAELGRLKSRSGKLDDRLTSLESQTAAVQGTLKKSLGSLESLSTFGNAVEELSNTVKLSEAKTDALKQSVEAHLVEWDKASANTANKLVARLDVSTKTMKVAIEEQEQLRKDVLEFLVEAHSAGSREKAS